MNSGRHNQCRKWLQKLDSIHFYATLLHPMSSSPLSDHSNRWDDDERKQKASQVYGPSYQRFGERKCQCAVCHHVFVYECNSAACKCCAGG